MKVDLLRKLLEKLDSDNNILVPAEDGEKLTDNLILKPLPVSNGMEGVRHWIIAPAEGKWSDKDWKLPARKANERPCNSGD